MSAATRWRWIRHEGQKLYDVGINDDGSLHNPNGYPEDLVRSSIADAQERLRARRKASAAKAAETRRRRHERRVYEVAQRIADGGTFGPANNCVCCKKGIHDPESIQRGIGSDCWQGVLARIEERRS